MDNKTNKHEFACNAGKVTEYEVKEHIDTIMVGFRGFSKEVSIVKWNDKKPVFDIRAWRVSDRDGLQYLKKHMKGNYSNEILKQLNVSSMECNITIKCVGKCKPKDVINLFEKSVDKTFIAQEARDKKKTFRKDQDSIIYRKDHYYRLKVYNKSKEQNDKGNPLVESNLIRVEFVFLERMLDSMYADRMSLEDILTRKSLRKLIDQYQETFTDICEKNIKPMSYEVTYKGHQRIDDTGKPYYVNEYTESYTVPTQYKVFFTLSLFCGFRKGETLALHWNDIDFKEKKISISKSVGMTENGFDYKEPKTKKSVRKVSIPDDVIPLLKQYHFEYIQTRFSHGTAWQGDLSNGGNLFIQADGKLMGHTTPYQYFTKHLHRYNEWVQNNPDKAKAEGLEELPIIPLHGLRHSCATLLNYLEVNIIEISKTLGHSTCSTTMNIYAHSFEEQQEEVATKVNEFLRLNA